MEVVEAIRAVLSVGDNGETVDGGAGGLQDLQVPPDLLPHLLQLHDPRPRPGETPRCHQTSGSGQLPLQESHTLIRTNRAWDL